MAGKASALTGRQRRDQKRMVLSILAKGRGAELRCTAAVPNMECCQLCASKMLGNTFCLRVLPCCRSPRTKGPHELAQR